jgi:hypothetical protein
MSSHVVRNAGIKDYAKEARMGKRKRERYSQVHKKCKRMRKTKIDLRITGFLDFVHRSES